MASLCLEWPHSASLCSKWLHCAANGFISLTALKMASLLSKWFHSALNGFILLVAPSLWSKCLHSTRNGFILLEIARNAFAARNCLTLLKTASLCSKWLEIALLGSKWPHSAQNGPQSHRWLHFRNGHSPRNSFILAQNGFSLLTMLSFSKWVFCSK